MINTNRFNSTKTKLRVTEMRKKLGLSQAEFWTPLGVTQSAGSRYENTAPGAVGIPASILSLVDLVYGEKPLAKLAAMRGVPVSEINEGK